MNEPKQTYPLQWPVGYERTRWRENSKFKQSMDRSQRFLRDEVARLKGSELIISTNLRVRSDGGLYAADMDKLIDDPGVAIYFNWKKKEISMCCDKYRRVWENIFALAKGIEALRGMERWGVSDFIDRAFTGFAALPQATQTDPFAILGISKMATYDEIKAAYRKLAMTHHPDKGGDTEKFNRITTAYNYLMKL